MKNKQNSALKHVANDFQKESLFLQQDAFLYVKVLIPELSSTVKLTLTSAVTGPLSPKSNSRVKIVEQTY